MSLVDLLARRRGLGWVPNEPDGRDLDVDKLGLAGAAPERADLTPFMGVVRHQRSSSSCVGQALAAAATIREAEAGFDAGPASALHPYYHARRMAGPVVRDVGTRMRLACKSMVKLGIPDDEHWPFRMLRVNRRPGWDAERHAYHRRGGGYYGIFDYGAGRVSAVKAALAEGHPVVFGTQVARSFGPSHGPDVIDRPLPDEALLGGHAMVLVGYETRPADGLLFRCLNSWGGNWRLGGTCWLTERYVSWERTRDLTIIDGWDRIRA